MPCEASDNKTIICIEKIGLFSISRESQNLTNARESCQSSHSFLADVTSEERSHTLASLITNDTVSLRVGLTNEGKEHIWKNEQSMYQTDIY